MLELLGGLSLVTDIGTGSPLEADLIERQVEVLRLVSRGLSNAEIAERLVLSRRTVEHHVQDAYVEIGAATRAAATLFAMQHGLLDQSGYS
jgi:DNA-binding NarL/FixJ family response regulator